MVLLVRVEGGDARCCCCCSTDTGTTVAGEARRGEGAAATATAGDICFTGATYSSLTSSMSDDADACCMNAVGEACCGCCFCCCKAGSGCLGEGVAACFRNCVGERCAGDERATCLCGDELDSCTFHHKPRVSSETSDVGCWWRARACLWLSPQVSVVGHRPLRTLLVELVDR